VKYWSAELDAGGGVALRAIAGEARSAMARMIEAKRRIIFIVL
jgi:hypothetical protein